MFDPEVLPPPMQDLLAVTGHLTTDHLALATPEERASWLVGLRRAIDQCEAHFLHTLHTFDAHGDGDTLHASRSTASWLKGALHLSHGDAAERVRLARHGHDHLKTTMTLLESNSITFDQVRAVAAAVRPLPAEAIDSGVTILNELSTHGDAGVVRAAGRRLRATVDPDGSLSAADKDFSRRWVSISPMLDGMVNLQGLLDAEAATTLTAALSPFLVPSDADDDRSAQQRRADGLVELARLALDHNKLSELGGSPPRLEVTCTLPTLTGQLAAPPALLPDAPGGAAPLTRDALARLGCNADVARILTTAQGVPLELGRDTRLFTPSQRKALAARDGGCRFPGCGMPPAFTDAHHIASWLDGGHTDLPNGVLLCRHHHRRVHRHGWHIRSADPPAGANADLEFVGPNGQRLRAPLIQNPRAP